MSNETVAANHSVTRYVATDLEQPLTNGKPFVYPSGKLKPLGARMMSEKKQHEWITTNEAAEIMKIHVSNVRYLCREEKITCRKFGKAWQVSKQDAEDYVRSGRDPKWLHKD